MECYHGMCSVGGTYSVDLSKSAQSVGILGHYTNKLVWKQKKNLYIIIKHTYINQYINNKVHASYDFLSLYETV